MTALAADIENRLIALTVALCPHTAAVRDSDGYDCGGILICTLPRHHEAVEPLHFDQAEGIWWRTGAAKIIGRYMRERGHDPADPGYGSERGRITGVINKAFNIKSTNDITTTRDAIAYLAHVQSYLGIDAESA